MEYNSVQKYELLINKKTSHKWKVLIKFEHLKNYLAFLAYLLLNLSIRPAVSISLDLPV